MTVPHSELMYLARYGYIALFAIIATSEFYSFLPVGVVLIAVGALVKQGYFNFFLALGVAAFASTLADAIVYRIAKRLGSHGAYQRFVEKNRFASHIQFYVRTFPRLTILVSRFVGIATTPVNALAGLSQMPLVQFISFDFLGNAICGSIYLGIGYFLGAAWNVDSHITAIGLGILAVFILLGYLIYSRFFKNKKPEEG